MYARLLVIAFALIGAACQPYQAVESGSNKVGELTINTSHGWAQINPLFMRSSGPTALWTHDGLALNQLLFYAPLEEGGALFEDAEDDHPYPAYRSDMQEADLQELIEDSLERFYVTGPIAVERIAPRDFAGAVGFELAMSFAAKQNDLEYRAIAAGAQIGGRLFLVIYIAPRLHYFDAQLPEVQAIVNSISPPTVPVATPAPSTVDSPPDPVLAAAPVE